MTGMIIQGNFTQPQFRAMLRDPAELSTKVSEALALLHGTTAAAAAAAAAAAPTAPPAPGAAVADRPPALPPGMTPAAAAAPEPEPAELDEETVMLKR